MSEQEALELTYSLGTASRLTGISPGLLRAWERRYQAVEPVRTPGGTRRYSAADLERLRLLKTAVDAGHRISKVARLDTEALRKLGGAPEVRPDDRLEEVIAALDRFDAAEVSRLLSVQLSTLGAVRFAQDFALPLVHEIGDRWAREQLCIASEHLASVALRSLMGSAMQPGAAALAGPVVLFATLTGERHELGLQMAALTAMGAGANPLYLGAELPVEEILAAADRAKVRAVGLSFVSLPRDTAQRGVEAVRGALPDEVCLWTGGLGSRDLVLPSGVERLDRFDDLEQRVALLALEH